MQEFINQMKEIQEPHTQNAEKIYFWIVQVLKVQVLNVYIRQKRMKQKLPGNIDHSLVLRLRTIMRIHS